MEEKFLIHVDATDWKAIRDANPLDVRNGDEIINCISEGKGTTEVAKNIFVAQEEGEVEVVFISPKYAMLEGGAGRVAQHVASRKVDHDLGNGKVVRTREFKANRMGRPVVFQEGDLEEEEPEPAFFLHVEEKSSEVTEAATEALMKFTLGNVRNRLAEIRVSAGVEEMKQAASEFKREVDDIVEALNGD